MSNGLDIRLPQPIVRIVDSHPALFVIGCWITSRLIVLAGLLGPAPHTLNVVENWDGAWYRAIASHGYEFVADGRWHSIAFFPLYPYLVALVMRSGMGFDVAAILINNASFLAMLFVVYRSVDGRNGIRAARWTTALLAFFPLSLFGSIAYPEGLFMLLSALTLRDFDRGRFGAAAAWAALASFTRPNGILLAPAFAAGALLEHRGNRALLISLAPLAGFLAMALFCTLRFGDPLAFVHAQQAWRTGFGHGMREWGILLASGSVSFGHWQLQFYLLGVVLVLWAVGSRLHWIGKLGLSSIVIVMEQFLWGRDFPFAFLALLGTAAICFFRERLGFVPVVYGFVTIIVLFGSGIPISADRVLFGALPFSLAAGLFMERLPFFGVPIILVSAFALLTDATAFAKALWVA